MTKVVKGRAAARIVEHAERENVGLIAMSTHGRSGLARWVMGSGIDRILRACQQPLLLVRPRGDGVGGEAAGPLSRIIVPLDGSDAAEAALPFVEELAKALGLEIMLVNVMAGVTAVQFGSAEPKSWQVPSHVLERLDVVASGYLAGLATVLQNKGLVVEWDVLRGAPGPRIVELAKDTPGSLVAMTTHGRSGLRRWILGSVADELVRRTGEPVLLIRPVERSEGTPAIPGQTDALDESIETPAQRPWERGGGPDSSPLRSQSGRNTGAQGSPWKDGDRPCSR